MCEFCGHERKTQLCFQRLAGELARRELVSFLRGQCRRLMEPRGGGDGHHPGLLGLGVRKETSR